MVVDAIRSFAVQLSDAVRDLLDFNIEAFRIGKDRRRLRKIAKEILDAKSLDELRELIKEVDEIVSRAKGELIDPMYIKRYNEVKKMILGGEEEEPKEEEVKEEPEVVVISGEEEKPRKPGLLGWVEVSKSMMRRDTRARKEVRRGKSLKQFVEELKSLYRVDVVIQRNDASKVIVFIYPKDSEIEEIQIDGEYFPRAGWSVIVYAYRRKEGMDQIAFGGNTKSEVLEQAFEYIKRLIGSAKKYSDLTDILLMAIIAAIPVIGAIYLRLRRKKA